MKEYLCMTREESVLDLSPRGFSRTGSSGYENLNSSTKAHLCKSGHRMIRA